MHAKSPGAYEAELLRGNLKNVTHLVSMKVFLKTLHIIIYSRCSVKYFQDNLAQTEISTLRYKSQTPRALAKSNVRDR